jgi:NAD dependent epimerase/dehydratase
MPSIKNKKILVTGSDGFIGSHLVETLVAHGAQVRAFVYYNSFNSWGWLDSLTESVKSQIEVFSGDVRDPRGVREAMHGCEVVMHLAALIGIPFSYHSPDSYVDTNIKGTLNVLNAARDLNVAKVLSTSTSEVYGSAQYVPINEEHPLQGQSPYSATKIAADQLALSFWRSFKTPVVIVRPFNTFGPRQSARAVIPTIISQIAAGQTKIQLGETRPTRDFTYVTDTALAFVHAAESDKTLGEVINFGSNFEISIRDLVLQISDLMQTKVTVEATHERIRPKDSEVERLWAANQKAKELCGWSPTVSFTEGLKRTITWFRDPKNLALYKTNTYNV